MGLIEFDRQAIQTRSLTPRYRGDHSRNLLCSNFVDQPVPLLIGEPTQSYRVQEGVQIIKAEVRGEGSSIEATIIIPEGLQDPLRGGYGPPSEVSSGTRVRNASCCDRRARSLPFLSPCSKNVQV